MLKKAVGQARKGWKLERVKGSTEDIQAASVAAYDMIKKLIGSADDDSVDGCTFVFSRRTMDNEKFFLC